MPAKFGVVDLFAGPGGLGEGFVSFSEDGHTPFRISISVENEVSAHRTLRLRSFLRAYKAMHDRLPSQFIDFHAGLIQEPNWEEIDKKGWSIAEKEAQALTLGSKHAISTINDVIDKIHKGNFKDSILIGGPPCQAYSLVGRVRSRSELSYVPEKDSRHYLFREYVRVLEKLEPVAFVMENVPGILTSSLKNKPVIKTILKQLRYPGGKKGPQYKLYEILVDNNEAYLEEEDDAVSNFVVHAEDYGVPQRRHRVIIIGIRSNITERVSNARIKIAKGERTVKEIIGKMPKLRSGLSRGIDDPSAWRDAVVKQANYLAKKYTGSHKDSFRKRFSDIAMQHMKKPTPPRAATDLYSRYGKSKDDLMSWVECPHLRGMAQHQTRGHMEADLGRYMYSAVFGEELGVSPKAGDFPRRLHPNHANWGAKIFSDRFRVQIGGRPSTTVTSHISKDGNYFIHPDPMQCRSLTVREAARLQTFPDDYLFLGNRTQQYIQVGNAVPPYLARQIAALLWANLKNL